MTPSEEREYLIDLLFEGTRWKVDQDEVLNGLELEVRDRLRRLSGVNTIDQEGLCQSNPPDNLPAEDENLTGGDEHLASPEKVDDARKQWESSKVRCSENGRLVWHPRSECRKVPRDNSKGGPAWKWQWMGPQDKKAQEDQMWENHEAGND